MRPTRRFLPAAAAALLTACMTRWRTSAEAASGIRLQARPGRPVTPCQPGMHPVNGNRQRESLLYVPKSSPPDGPAPLMVFLHGATGSAERGIKRWIPLADQLGFLVLAPSSEGSTWDAIQDGYGPDVSLIDHALTSVFAKRSVDAKRIALSGFSDGASYALGLGLSNGDLFSSLLAFSPGFIPSGAKPAGKPRIFVSHGTDDSILPIATCSRRLVPELTRAGYDVTYREFDGPHTVPPEIAEAGLRWFLA